MGTKPSLKRISRDINRTKSNLYKCRVAHISATGTTSDGELNSHDQVLSGGRAFFSVGFGYATTIQPSKMGMYSTTLEFT